jgi:hypothetical protein
MLLIAAAWYGVLCWGLVANVLYRFDRTAKEPGPAMAVLRAAVERPWLGFVLGTVPVTAIWLTLFIEVGRA